jgi:predicted kinase
MEIRRTLAPEGGSRPLALLVCGTPGSGKSTVGALLARRLGAALLDLDSATAGLTAVIAGLQGTEDLDDPELARLTRAARYETIASLAEDNLAAGINVVMVAPFTQERRDPEAWRTLELRMDQAGASATMVWLRICADEVRRRIKQRGAGRDLAKRRGDRSASLDPPAVPHLAVDALLSPHTIAETVMSALLADQGSPGGHR